VNSLHNFEKVIEIVSIDQQVSFSDRSQ